MGASIITQQVKLPNATISHEYQFQSQLLHCRSSSLLIQLVTHLKMATVLKPLALVKETQMEFRAPCFGLA